MFIFFFFFNDTATTEIYTLSLHDALPIYVAPLVRDVVVDDGHARVVAVIALRDVHVQRCERVAGDGLDRKSTRLNSSHANISYAVLCLKLNQSPASAHLCDRQHAHEQLAA